MELLVAEAAHWGLALVPVLVLLAIFTWLDAFALMRLREILLLLALGGVAAMVAYPISGRMIDTLPIGFNFYSRYVAPWIEEALKALVMIALFRMNRIGYKLDAVVSGFAIGAGFSVVENILYLTMFPDYGAGTWLVRGLGTAVMHGTTLALLAAIAHELAERENREAASDFHFNLLWFVPGYLLAVAIHTAFNHFPDRPLVAMMGAIIVAPIAIMAIFHFGTAEAQGWLAAEAAEHRAQLDALRAGNWPDSASGRKIGALAARLDPGRGQAGAALLGAAGVAGARGRGDHARRGRGRCDDRQAAGPLRPRRARRPQARARPKHPRRAQGPAPVQPQRLLGSQRAQAAPRLGPRHRSALCRLGPGQSNTRGSKIVRSMVRCE